MHGQTHGGIAQGVGQALLENSYYEPQHGQLLTASFMDYAMSRADTLPFLDTALSEVPRYDPEASASEQSSSWAMASRGCGSCICRMSGLASPGSRATVGLRSALGSLGGKEWLIGVAPPGDLNDDAGPRVADIAAFRNSLVPLEMVLATNSAMLGADLSKTSDEIELSRNKGHQGHGGLEDRIRQTMRAEGISFAEAIRRPRNMMVGTPAMIAFREPRRTALR